MKERGKPTAPAGDWLPEKWDSTAEVVVIGYGATGAVAAITAAEAGAGVVILEKAPEAGGSSSTSSGGMRCVDNAAQTARYLKSIGLGTIDDATAEAFARTWTEMKPWLEKHGAVLGQDRKLAAPRDAGRPDNFDIMFLEGQGDYLRGCGRDLFNFLDGIVKGLGVEVRLNTPARRLVQHPVTKEILGVIAASGGKDIRIKATRAVIMACGGFAGSPEMLTTYIDEAPVKMYPTGTPYCTGDGIRMAIDIGADLWHMNAIEWATQGFKPDEMPAAFWLQPKGRGWINVNRHGKRFRDESISLAHSKRHPEIFDFAADPATGDADWVNSPWYIVFDEKVRQAGPIILTERMAGSPRFITYISSREIYDWSQDNSAEIDKGWISRADSIPQLAAAIGVDPAQLQGTVDKYNQSCAAGLDGEYNRKLETLAPLDTSPYYAMECVLGIINTQGGPRRNARSQVVSAWDGSPIPRLYAGGEFGSLFSFLYPGACNLSECIVSGLLTGRHAAAEKPWG